KNPEIRATFGGHVLQERAGAIGKLERLGHDADDGAWNSIHGNACAHRWICAEIASPKRSAGYSHVGGIVRRESSAESRFHAKQCEERPFDVNDDDALQRVRPLHITSADAISRQRIE